MKPTATDRPSLSFTDGGGEGEGENKNAMAMCTNTHLATRNESN
jgi:hypothetical protein